MEKTAIPQDIPTYSLAAASFPEGVLEAHQKLHAMVPYSENRGYFGISRPENGNIMYWAAAEKLPEESQNTFNLETFVIKKGDYIYKEIKNFRSNVRKIGKAFQELLQHPQLDLNSYCLEWYTNENDVRCMVKII